MDSLRQTTGGRLFVGRDGELAALRMRLEDACAGRGSLTMVAGEPGVGKTRLVRECASLAQQDGARVLWGRYPEGEWQRPFAAWVEALGGLVRAIGTDRLHHELGQGASTLAQLVPGLVGSPADQTPAPGLPGHQARFRLYEAIARLLVLAVRECPTLLILDDLHWADRDSLSLLRYAAHAIPQAGLMLVATYRAEDLGRDHPLADLLGELARDDSYSRIALRGLSESDLSRYLSLAAGRELPAGLVRRIHEDTGGNPFYVRELFRHLAEQGRLARATWELANADLGVPEDVAHVVRRRFRRLSPEARAVLRLGAAFPSGFEFGLVQALIGQSRESLLDSLDEAQRAGFVRAVIARPGVYRFAHAIVRHAVYGDLTAGQRVGIHQRIGTCLEQAAGPNVERRVAELAYHACQALPAGDPERALSYTLQAAMRATSMLAHADAAQHLQRAIAILDDIGPAPDERRYELLLKLGEAYLRAGDWLRAKEALVQAGVAAQELEPRLGPERATELIARAAVALPGAVVAVGVVDERLVTQLEAALASLGDREALRAKALARLAAELSFSPDRDRRIALCSEAIELARRQPDPTVLAYVLECGQLALWDPATIHERLMVIEELLRLAERTGDRDLAELSQSWRVTAVLEAGDWPAIEAALRDHQRSMRQSGNPIHRWHAAMWAAMRALVAGRYAEAAANSTGMATIMRQTSDPEADLFFGVHSFMAARDRGGLEALEPALRSHADQYPDLAAVGAWLALLYAELGRPDEARVEFERLARADFTDLSHDVTWLSVMAFLAEVCAALGDADRAALLYRHLLPYADGLVWFGHGVAWYGVVARPLGRLAATLGRATAAAEHFEAALRLYAAIGAEPERVRTQIQYSGLLLADGRARARERAQVLLEQACATARRLELVVLLGQAETLRSGTLRGRSSRADGLTPREQDVAARIARGLSNREIAETLTLSERTVEMHVSHLLAKSKLPSRTALAVWAVEHRMLDSTTARN
ncbi:MAG: AAA family ATPase [Chloroflexi bacterium]|nr:AAA family ATPase [Chloroflexota bacterium]